ncbi:TPA: DUF1372 family protein [Streptococcus suis]|nr:DUF1372 family protein [Streptococcus suis]
MKQAFAFLGLLLIFTFWFSTYHIKQLQNKVAELEARTPIIIYQVDNYGGELVGKVTDKAIIEGVHTVTIGAYGKFIVTQEQFDSINVGDDVPDFLKKRGS